MTEIDTEQRVALIGRIVRKGIRSQADARYYTALAEAWEMPTASFSRLKDEGRAGRINHRRAEVGLGLPLGLFDSIRAGEDDEVAALVPKIDDEDVRDLIVTTLRLPGGKPRTPRPRNHETGS